MPVPEDGDGEIEDDKRLVKTLRLLSYIPSGLSIVVSRPSWKAALQTAAESIALQMAFPVSASVKGKKRE